MPADFEGQLRWTGRSAAQACRDRPILGRPVEWEEAEPDFGLDGPEPLPSHRPVSPGILRSGQPTREGLKQLADSGIRTILNLREWGLRDERAEREEVRRLGMSYARVGMIGILPPTFSQVDRALAVLLDPESRPVLIHCKHGRDRTGVVVAAYRVVAEKWELRRAADEAKGFGCCPKFYRGLEGWLKDYLRHRAKPGPD